jgi:hypothetical protein
MKSIVSKLFKSISIIFLAHYSYGQVPSGAMMPDPAGATRLRTATVQGKVKIADSNAGVGKVTVSLRAIGSRPGQPNAIRTVLTDDAGQFRFSGVLPGRYRLVASRPGHGLGERSAGDARSIAVLPSGTAPNVELALTPLGAIGGQISGTDGGPLSRVTVRISHWRTDNGNRRLMPAGMAQTDDQGRFRLFDVPAGNYFLSASFKPSATTAGRATYAHTFYPGVLTSQEATQVHVAPGAEVGGINLVMKEAPRFAISGKVQAVRGIRVGDLPVMI